MIVLYIKEIFLSIMARSLDDVWRQMQAQQAAQQQQRMAQERALYEQRERQRQEYLQRQRMYEASFSPSAAASSAAGAGAGGGRLVSQNQDFPSVTAQSTIISYVDTADGLWKFVVYNFTSGQLSQTYTTDLLEVDWNLNADDRTVQYKGFTLDFAANVGNEHRIYFVNAGGTVVGTKILDSDSIAEYTERAIVYRGTLSGVRTVYHFDGDNVRTHTFDANVSIDVNDGSGDDVTKDGSIVIESPDNNNNYAILRPNGDLIDISQYLVGGSSDSFRTDYNTDFILKVEGTSSIRIVSQEGELVNTFDLTPFDMQNLTESALYGENCAVIWYSRNTTKLVVSYDGDSNQFVSLTFSTDSYDVDFHKRSWYNGQSSFGKNLIAASFNGNNTDNIGYVTSYLDLWYLPKGATEFNHIDLNSVGTVSYVHGAVAFTDNRSFSLGENPIFMYAPEGGEIIVGFLEEAGYSTQSTGIMAASCSNIWGHCIGEHSFAVFDVGSNRIWQMYDANSIVDETQTSSSWSWGDASTRSALRNGTLAVIDSLDTSNSFIYTSEIGLMAGPTGLGDIYNYPYYGNNTGLSYEYQVITQFIPGEEGNEYVEGFYVLSKSGLSNYVEFFGGSSTYSYTIESYSGGGIPGYTIGSDIISFKLVDSVTSFVRYQVYNTNTLALLHDWDTGQSTPNYNSYDNRFVAEYYDNVGNVEFRLVSSLGVEILNLQTTNHNRESNDTVDND